MQGGEMLGCSFVGILQCYCGPTATELEQHWNLMQPIFVNGQRAVKRSAQQPQGNCRYEENFYCNCCVASCLSTVILFLCCRARTILAHDTPLQGLGGPLQLVAPLAQGLLAVADPALHMGCEHLHHTPTPAFQVCMSAQQLANNGRIWASHWAATMQHHVDTSTDYPDLAPQHSCLRDQSPGKHRLERTQQATVPCRDTDSAWQWPEQAIM